MTRDGDFKRLVRDRAASTGESYQTALRQLRPENGATEASDHAALVDNFERTGIVKLTDVFSDESAAAMREVVWRGWADTYGGAKTTLRPLVAHFRINSANEGLRHATLPRWRHGSTMTDTAEVALRLRGSRS